MLMLLQNAVICEDGGDYSAISVTGGSVDASQCCRDVALTMRVHCFGRRLQWHVLESHLCSRESLDVAIFRECERKIFGVSEGSQESGEK